MFKAKSNKFYHENPKKSRFYFEQLPKIRIKVNQPISSLGIWNHDNNEGKFPNFAIEDELSWTHFNNMEEVDGRRRKCVNEIDFHNVPDDWSFLFLPPIPLSSHE